MDTAYFINQSTALLLVIIISLIFTVLGLYHSRKFQGINNYLTANRNIKFFSLTTSLVASALGAWILFGPASAATWGCWSGNRLCTRYSFSNDFFNLSWKKT